MADCEHNGRHLHCNICGGAPCAECFGSIAPSPDAFGMRRGPNIELVYQNKIAALRAKLEAAEQPKPRVPLPKFTSQDLERYGRELIAAGQHNLGSHMVELALTWRREVQEAARGGERG